MSDNMSSNTAMAEWYNLNDVAIRQLIKEKNPAMAPYIAWVLAGKQDQWEHGLDRREYWNVQRVINERVRDLSLQSR